ncbi:hypothetical protein Trihar35433_2759 [Trichoderma harzianum]|nr:hypothetical protein Trihar35433_2759 [Trichoderma harzianum]
MATDQSNPGDFISLSSEDEPPLAKKRKSPENDTSSVTGLDAPAERSKRARVSSASAGSSPGAKVSEEGEIDDDEDSEGEVRTPSSRDGKKSGGFASSGAFVPKSPPVYTSDSISLQLPVFSQQREGTWLARFEEWAQLLCTANSTSASKLTPMVILAAYKQYIDTHSRLKTNKKRAARQAAEQFKDEYLAALIRSLQPHQKDTVAAAAPEALGEPKTQSNASSELPEAQGSHKGENSDPTAQLPPNSLTPQTDGYFVIDVKPQPPQTANSREPRPMSQPAPQSAKTTMSQRPGLPSGEDALEQQRRATLPTAAHTARANSADKTTIGNMFAHLLTSNATSAIFGATQPLVAQQFQKSEDAASTSSAIIGADEIAPKQQSGDLRIRGHASRSNEVRYYSDSDDSDDVQFLSQRAVPKPINSLLCLQVHHLLIHLRRLPIAHQDAATHRHRLGQTRSLPGRRLHRVITEAYHRLHPNLHRILANSLDEEVEVVVEVVAEEAGEEAQEEAEATEEENSEAVGVEVVKPSIVMEFGNVQTRREPWDSERNKHTLGDSIQPFTLWSAVSGATYFDTPLSYGFSILKQGFDETRWCWLIAT